MSQFPSTKYEIHAFRMECYVLLYTVSINESIECLDTFSSIDGKKIQERIIGGEDSHISEVPWQVQLTITKKNIGFICGGSWISPGRNDGMMDFVLTAAHCIDGVSVIQDMKKEVVNL
uniref:Peptidase S1 domain-containing protein n=1 Tax=Romanomermis culicivorax TaxID=13658 RepID=A0A915KG25_ROMCU